MMPHFPVCENCWHGRPHGEGFDGKCRRYPPQAGVYPRVFNMEFCGEFQRAGISPAEVADQVRQYLAEKAKPVE